MALEFFTKQPYEEITIAGDFVRVLAAAETIVVGTSAVSAINKATGADSTSIVLDVGTIGVDGSKLKMRCRAGDHKATHKITFRAVTSDGNKFEIDVLMKVKET